MYLKKVKYFKSTAYVKNWINKDFYNIFQHTFLLDDFFIAYPDNINFAVEISTQQL